MTTAKLKLLGKEAPTRGRGGKPAEEKNLTRTILIGIVVVFVFYNLVFLAMTQSTDPHAWTSMFGNVATLGFFYSTTSPSISYIFGTALTLFFIASAVLVSVTKIRNALIASKLFAVLFFAGVFAGMYGCAYLFSAFQFYTLPFLLVLSTVWLIFQSANYYTLSRGFSTKIETRLVERYSKVRLTGALIFPLIVLGVLVFVSWGYRYWWVTIALDITGQYDPVDAVQFYSFIMTVVIPAVYFIVILITLFIILEFALTFKRAETRTSGIWDNLTFSLMSLFLFVWMLFMVTLYLLLSPQTQGLLSGLFFSGSGGTGNTGTILLFAEFGISMLFLVSLVKQVGASFGWKFLFLRRDGLIFFLLAIIMGQSVSRYAIFQHVETQYFTGGFAETLLSSDRLIIPMLLIIFLGITVLIYYLRPQQVSMFMRREQEAIEEQDKAKDLVLKFLRREFIRKGKKFRVDSVDKRIVELTNLPMGVVHSLISRISDEYVDIVLEEEIVEGGKIKYIDFVPITEKYQESAEADKKAKTRLTEQLAGSLKAKSSDRQRILVKTKKKLSKQKNAVAGDLISTLQSSFSKKAKEEKEDHLKTMDFKKDLKEDVAEIIMQFLRSEYISRVKQTEDIPDPAMKLSDIAEHVEEVTKVNPAELASVLDIIALQNANIVVEDNPDDPNDKIIDFMPVSDMEISDLVEQLRPAKLSRLIIYFWNELSEAVKVKRNNIVVPTERHDERFNIAIEQMLQNMQHMWIDAGHPRFKPQKIAQLNSIVEQLMPKKATGWKEYIATGRIIKFT
ncbi:MAG TPA: hypothetical protein VKK79_01960 [Candidatus Lokiarchaeia archaeon]|nr:hypothetical protein [Candidatus Lokiarchaeia archaeon]